ncbi:MAG: peptidylprolyl isomerase [Clostridiales bacterium]|nr:peptidylprolyl isomerase [Clostridiales bacterium]
MSKIKEKQGLLLGALVVVVVAFVIVAILTSGVLNNGPEKNAVVTMEIEEYGTVTMELYYDKAPNTVRNFISLIKAGYYDNTLIPRVAKGFVVQAGRNDEKKLDYTIKGEFPNNGFRKNDLSNARGTIAMARNSSNVGTIKAENSAASEFYINVANNSAKLDGSYAVFGKVTSGLDILVKISKLDNDGSNGTGDGKPTKDIRIKSVTVETFGFEYGEPTKIMK